LPFFGDYKKQRENLEAREIQKENRLENGLAPNRPANELARPVPQLQEIIGRTVPRVGTYKQLDNKQQVVALIDEVIFKNMYHKS